MEKPRLAGPLPFCRHQRRAKEDLDETEHRLRSPLAALPFGATEVLMTRPVQMILANGWRSNARALAVLACVIGFFSGEGAAFAQAVDCNRLQQQIIALGPPNSADPARAQQFRDAAQRQASELDRTVAYSNSIGCGRRQLLFFDDSPRECSAIGQQIARMRANLADLRQQAAQAGGDDATRRDLVARFDASCRGAQPQQRSAGGFFDNLFGRSTPSGNLAELPMEGDPLNAEEPGSGSLAVCVRSCDGGFFPVSYSASRARYQELGELCQAMCPNVETQLFTMAFGREIEQSVSAADGRPYASHPNAGRFRTKYDPACTCKKADQSWSEALGNAERMLGRDSRRDQIVTPERAAELSRPQAPKAPPAKKPDPKAAAAAAAADRDAAAEAAIGSQAPTASRDSTSIAAGGVNNGRIYSLSDGAKREVTAPDGTKKTVRTVGPQL